MTRDLNDSDDFICRLQILGATATYIGLFVIFSLDSLSF